MNEEPKNLLKNSGERPALFCAVAGSGGGNVFDPPDGHAVPAWRAAQFFGLDAADRIVRANSNNKLLSAH